VRAGRANAGDPVLTVRVPSVFCPGPFGPGLDREQILHTPGPDRAWPGADLAADLPEHAPSGFVKWDHRPWPATTAPTQRETW